MKGLKFNQLAGAGATQRDHLAELRRIVGEQDRPSRWRGLLKLLWWRRKPQVRPEWMPGVASGYAVVASTDYEKATWPTASGGAPGSPA
jgi:hypothetical protein